MGGFIVFALLIIALVAIMVIPAILIAAISSYILKMIIKPRYNFLAVMASVILGSGFHVYVLLNSLLVRVDCAGAAEQCYMLDNDFIGIAGYFAAPIAVIAALMVSLIILKRPKDSHKRAINE
ncbi:MAG: hypothetical protein HC843_00840 [Sphingomonadales bacterium]|nr:hypothetical protein [Sphingomonadales bacterium]